MYSFATPARFFVLDAIGSSKVCALTLGTLGLVCTNQNFVLPTYNGRSKEKLLNESDDLN